MHDLSDVNINELFTMVEDDSQAIYTCLYCRKYFYSPRVITPFNNLSQKNVTAKCVNALKNNLDDSYGTNWRSHKSS